MFFPGDTFPKENSQSANGTVIASHAYHLAQAGGVVLASQVTKYHLGFRFHEEAIITGEGLSPFYRETFIMRTIISTVRISTPALKAGIVPAPLSYHVGVYTAVAKPGAVKAADKGMVLRKTMAVFRIGNIPFC